MAFTDDFTGAPGQYLEDRTGWTREDGAAGACQVNASNQLKIVSTTETAYTHDAGVADHYAQALVSYSSEIDMRFFPVCVRVADSNNFYGFRPYQDKKEIYKRVGGTFTLKAQIGGGGGGVTWRLSCSGNSFTLLGNGSDQGMGFTDADLNTNTKTGIVARGDTLDPVLDNWESTEAAGGGTSEERDLSSAGVATASFSSKSLWEASLTSSGSATVSFEPKAQIKSTFTSSATAAVNFLGSQHGNAELTASGAAAVSFTGRTKHTGTLTLAALASASFEAKSLRKAVLSAAGDSQVQFRNATEGSAPPTGGFTPIRRRRRH